MTAIAWGIVLAGGMIAEAIEPGPLTQANKDGAVMVFVILVGCTFVEWWLAKK